MRSQVSLSGVWVVCTLCVTSCLAGSKYYTEDNQPYEFGFNITGEQHRHEKKDENGIIMGEFGFLTADDVYHVTVYATDENGNFKILSMKNLKVVPESKAVQPEEKHQSPPPPPPLPPSRAQPIAQKPISIPEAAPIRACSSCRIPAPTKPPTQLSDLAVVSQDGQEYPRHSKVNPRGRQLAPGNQENTIPEYEKQGKGGSIHHGQSESQGPFGSQGGTGNIGQVNQLQQQRGQIGNKVGQNVPGKIGQHTSSQLGPHRGQFAQQGGQFNSQTEHFEPQSGRHQTQQQSSKPTLISAQMQIVDSNTDINKLNPGEKSGLPKGLDKDDMLQLLYTFNYTVGFHAHHEEGYTNGVKKGYYYVTGRDGVRSRIDYVADSQGFHPKITTEVLDIISDEVPKPETEKEEQYGLKGYEFKWIYYPPISG